MTEDLRKVGDRIEQLLDELQAILPASAFDRLEDVISLVTQLYGAGLERIAAEMGPDRLERLAAGDDLVASLLVLHGLHPDQPRLELQFAPAPPPPPPSVMPVELTRKPARA